MTAGLLGPDRAKAAWQRVQQEFLNNPIPIELRVGLVCAAWEQRTGPSAIHATGMSLLGHDEAPVDLAKTWTAMQADPAVRHLAMMTRHVVLGSRLPPQEIQRVFKTLGGLRRAWQDLVGYAMWAESLYRTHASLVAPLEDARLDAWLEDLLEAGTLAVPFVRPPSDLLVTA